MKAAFYTLGCKVNQYESQYMAELLKNAGYEIVSPNEKADIYVVNSCTVTATADQKTRQNVRKYKRKNPNSIVILTGCMPQAYPEDAKELIEADIVLSNKNDNDILKLINEFNMKNERVIDLEMHKTGDPFAKCEISSFNERIRAFVKIEDGCDRFCSYCIIPTSRGRVRSKEAKDLQEEIELLANNGIEEIVLVGINLSAYGKGEDFDIVDAVSICANTKGIRRVRLGSLEPDHITDDIIERLAKIEKFCPQFHISLQSGCIKTLKDMNRHYDADEYKYLCDKLRRTFKDCSLTTDVMVGFNDETDEDFAESLAFVKNIGFEKVHTFPYSNRPGTNASKRGDNVPKHIKEERAAVMIKETDIIREQFFKSLIGTKVSVLFENEAEKNIYQGYTKNYTPVRKASNDSLIGKELEVTITDYNSVDYCISE